jgi:predicted phage-related endonuclease
MSTAIQGIPGPAAQSDEWKALRRFDARRERPVIFGASEAAAVCNVSPYSSPLQVYLEKRGEFETEEDSQAADMGRRLEPIILDLYEERTDCRLLREQRTYFHRDLPFMAATPDGLAYGETPDLFQWAVDSKSTSFRRFDASGENVNAYGIEGSDQIPLDALFQAQQQMAVTGLDRVDFPVLFDGRTLRVYTVQRNEDLLEQIIAAEEQLARNIRNGEPPEPNYWHEGTRNLLHKMFGFKDGKAIALPNEMKSLAEALQDARAARVAAEKAEEAAKAQIDHAMGDAEVLYFEDSKLYVTRKQNAPTLWNAGHIAKAEEHLADARSKQGQVKQKGSRPMCVRFAK